MRIATTGTLNTGDTFLVFHGPYKEIIPRMAAAGYDAVEMHIFDSAAIDRKELWDTLKENGMTLTSIGTGSVYGRKHYNLADHDPAVLKEAIKHLEQHMITAEPDQSLVILGLVAGRFSDCSGPEEFKANLEDSLYQLDRLAQSHDVKLGFEIMNQFESDYLTTIAEGVDYLKAHDFKRIRLHIDTVHMNIEEADIGAAIRKAEGYIGHVHLADNDRWYPGHAHYNFKETLQALKDIHYSGALALETNCLPSEEVSARKSLRYLQMLMEELN